MNVLLGGKYEELKKMFKKGVALAIMPIDKIDLEYSEYVWLKNMESLGKLFRDTTITMKLIIWDWKRR